MANVVNNSSSSNGGASVANLRDIYSYLEEPMNNLNLVAGGPYDKIVALIRQLDLEDDGIQLNQKIKAIEIDFCNIVKDENMLCESMDYINEKALQDNEIALKFALLFSSRNFDALAMRETKVRSAMLKILESNFLNAENFRIHDKERLYNSITLLGEYYNRVRLADNSPITILGESLIGLLMREIEGQDIIDSKLAKLILSQMTLNGDIMRIRHQTEITQLLFHIRRNLVEQSKLTCTVKALLLMTLDLYYRNFANLGPELENFYTKYLATEEQENAVKNSKTLQNSAGHGESQEQCTPEDGNNDSFAFQPSTKKWSEQVCEDAMFETEGLPDYDAGGDNHINTKNDRIDSNNMDNKRQDKELKAPRHSQGQRSPRPLKHSTNVMRNSREHPVINSPQAGKGEETDETKPLPRWRATRFNREDEQYNDGSRSRFRRFSGSFEDDHQSVRSEGGSIRLYSINDRLKHSQEKMERSNNNYSFIVNSNWDKQSQRDDRSERSYISNYEYGNKQRRGFRNYNSRQNYDKPPRFQKNRKQQQPHQQQPDDHQQNKEHVEDNWRRTRRNSNNSFHEDYNDARASTLPRPAKTNFDGSIKSASFRRSQSPTHQRDFLRNHQHRNIHRNYNSRNGSQTSIHSEEASEERCPPPPNPPPNQRQHNQNNKLRGGGGRRFPINMRRHHKQSDDNKPRDWDNNQVNSEEGQKENNDLVSNARKTTEYMNYLSSKK